MTTNENVVIDPIVRQLMEAAATGEAAKLFLQSELGRYIAGKAAEEVEEAIAQLIEADPHDAKEIQRLQTVINVAKQSIVYLTDAISIGNNALRELHEES